MGMHSTYTATHYKDLNIDWQARAVTRHGEDISLTPQEFALLQVLFDHRGQAVSSGDLLHTAWGYPSIGITRTVDVHIQHLRRKLGLKQEIQTIYLPMRATLSISRRSSAVMRPISPAASSNFRLRKYSAAYTACATSISRPPTATGTPASSARRISSVLSGL